jgi:hypothetical protein
LEVSALFEDLTMVLSATSGTVCADEVGVFLFKMMVSVSPSSGGPAWVIAVPSGDISASALEIVAPSDDLVLSVAE